MQYGMSVVVVGLGLALSVPACSDDGKTAAGVTGGGGQPVTSAAGGEAGGSGGVHEGPIGQKEASAGTNPVAQAGAAGAGGTESLDGLGGSGGVSAAKQCTAPCAVSERCCPDQHGHYPACRPAAECP